MGVAGDGLTFNTARFDAAVARLVMTSKKTSVEALTQQGRLLFVEVAKVTPPAGGAKGNTLQGKAAEMAGKVAVARDIHAAYGTPGQAFSDLLSKAGKGPAGAFWDAHKHGRDAEAAAIVRLHLKKSYSPFDGGKAAESMRGRWRKSGGQQRRDPLYYLRDPAPMHAYVREEQSHVWYLSSGWYQPLKALGAKGIPYGVNKHSAPGFLEVNITETSIEIKMINYVGYASRIKGLKAQIQFAMKVRTGRLDRAWAENLKRKSGGSGFKITA